MSEVCKIILEWIKKLLVLFCGKQKDNSSVLSVSGDIERSTTSDGATKFSEDEFIKIGIPLAIKREWNKFSIYVHSYHETGNFKRIIGNFNIFGIKVPKNWTGKVVEVTTHEWIGGKKIGVIDKFIDFENMEQLVIWYCEFIERVYFQAYKKRDNPIAYFYALVSNPKVCYATDPQYAQKLERLYRELSVNQEILDKFKKYLL